MDQPTRDESGRYADQPVRSVRPTPPHTTLDLRAALAVVWRRKWSILAITLLVIGVALFVSSRQTPIYESETRILVTPVSGVGGDTVVLPDPGLATEAELIASVAVAQIVAKDLGISGPPRALLNNLSVDQPTDTDILEIAYRHSDPRQAQQRAAAFASAFLQFRADAVAEAIALAANSLEEQLDGLVQNFSALDQRLERLSEDDPSRTALEVRLNTLSAQMTSLQFELAGLPDKVSVGSVIQPAPLPMSPVRPNHVLNGAFGVIAGLVLGTALAFLRDRLSERVRSIDEIEAHLDAPILATTPRVPSWRRRRDAFLVTAVEWRSPAAEGYRVLRTNVLAAAAGAGVKTIAITSANAGEGKSSTVANLGVVLARAGKRVSLVSADIRRPRLHDFFKRDGHPGLIDVLAGRLELEHGLQKIVIPTRGFDPGSSTLRLLPSGRVPEDPTELITSERMSKVLTELEAESDIVLVDLPPVLLVTDALVVAALTRYVLLVIGPRSDNRLAITSTRQQIERVGARIIGGVLNGPDRSISQAYYPY